MDDRYEINLISIFNFLFLNRKIFHLTEREDENEENNRHFFDHQNRIESSEDRIDSLGLFEFKQLNFNESNFKETATCYADGYVISEKEIWSRLNTESNTSKNIVSVKKDNDKVNNLDKKKVIRLDKGKRQPSDLKVCKQLQIHEAQIQNFFKRLYQHHIVSCPEKISTLLRYSIIYFISLFRNHPFHVNMIYPFFIVCFCIANKFVYDESYNNKTFSEFAAIEINQFNQVELFILKKINYKLHINYDIVKNFYF
jgi:hypothetical protein